MMALSLSSATVLTLARYVASLIVIVVAVADVKVANASVGVVGILL
jgi:hypothetical protein